MADQDIISTQIFQAKDLSFKSVTVYEDQAEVHRKLVLTLQQGLNRIQVENLPPKLDSETFRVDGHGSATIHEVQFKNRGWQEKKDEDSEELKELKKQIKELEEKKSKINVSLNTYVKHLKALDSLTTNVLKFSTSDVEKQPKLFDDAAEASLEKLFGYHEKKSSEIGIKGCQYEKEIKEIDEEIAKIKSKISQSQSNMVNKKSVVILLEATQADAKIELDITYQSKNASWKSSYDFRVRTNGKSEENKLQLVYFGNIQQSTGEDWKDTELILSTGQLKSAGSLPTITQLNAKFKSQSRRPVPPSCTFGGKPTAPFNFGTTQPATNQAPVLFGARASSQATSTSATFGAGQSSQNTGVNASTDQIEQPPTPPSVEFSECIASETNLSATFVVPQKKNIPSDESEHKVTIATLELDSIFYYACVPKKNRNVFLTAEIKNTSEFPLLSGNASIYLNSAFSSTTSIERIDIGETIKRSLGTDPGIKVEYKPVKSTYEKKLGVVSSNVYEQVILVKNNKNEAIVMTIYEQIPKSTNENINIKLILPEIREESEEKTAKEHDGKDKIGAKLNKLNNLEWKIQLAPDEEKELTVKWSIDYPQNESLEYYEIKEAVVKSFKFGITD